MSVDHVAQKDEVLALQSIFDPSEFSCQELNSEFSGKFNAFVALPEDFRIIYQMLPSFYPKLEKTQIELTKQASEELVVKYLPPLELSITLPLDYPSTSPPRFTLTSCWLDRKQLSSLCHQLDSLWEDNKGLEILLVWASFLKEDSYSFLGLDSTLDISKQFTRNIKCISNLKRMQRTRQNSDTKYPETATSVGAGSSGLSVETEKPDYSVLHVVNYGNGSLHSSQLKKSDKRRPGRGRGRGRSQWSDTQKSDCVCINPSTNVETPGLNVLLSNSNSEGSESPEGSSMNCSDPCNSGVSNSDNAGSGNKNKYFQRRVHTSSHNSLDERAVSSVPLDVSLIDFLKELNSLMTSKEFERNIFTCRTCFDNKPGSQCVEFYGCSHVFCQDCVKGYFEVRIKEGNIHSLTCLEEDCKSEAHQKQIREAVDPELFARYDDLLLSSTLARMEDVVYCPRRNCQYPVTRDGEDKMGRCPNCRYSFCILCRMGYHGVDLCRLKKEGESELVAEYETASADRKSLLEAMYGRKVIEELVVLKPSEKWISSNCKNCPDCQAAIEKCGGCSRMKCTRCNTYFCWNCSGAYDANLHHQCLLPNT